MEPAFGHDIYEIMYNGPHFSKKPGQLACFAGPFIGNLSGDIKLL
jgi:hypothetical protein